MDDWRGDFGRCSNCRNLRMHNNILSFWRCGAGTDEEINNVALAIAAGCDKIDEVEIVLIDD